MTGDLRRPPYAPTKCRFSTAICAVALLASGSFFGVAHSASATAKHVAIFDEAHGERFLPEHDGPLDLSHFATVLEDQGFAIKAADHAITDQVLAHVDVLLISGAFKPFTVEEVEVTTRFIERGGRLVVMLHIGPPVADLLHHLHTSISNGVICENENILEGTCANFRVTRLQPHELTKGVKEFSIFGGWALLSTGENASVIAETSPRAWIDLNGDGKLGPGDAVQSFGVLVTGQLGRGRFVVSGDDAVFQNQFLKEGNLRLATNLAAWLAELPI